MLTRGGRRIVLTEPLPPMPEVARIAYVTYAPTRLLDGVKSLSYAGNMLARRLAQERGFDEALLVTPHGRVLEAPTSTIFWVDSGGDIHTPEIESGILASITRDRIMKVVPVEESDSYQLKHVLEASEVFLASSLREVQGVRCLDGLEFTCPGPVTQRVAGLLSERIEAELSGALQLEGA